MGHELQPTLTKSPIGHIKPNGRQGRASTNAPKPCRPTNYNQHDRHQRYDFQRKSQLRAADTQNKLHRRPMNYNQSHRRSRFCFYKTRGGRAKAMKQPYAATLPPNELQSPNNAPRHPPRNNMHTKGRTTVQTTTRATAASPDARRRHGPNIAPTAAPA